MNMARFYLLAGLVVLPLSYVFLCRRMSRAVASPPKRPFFFSFGSLGGYLLLSAFEPSFFTMLIFLPFILLAISAVVWSFFASLRARPRSVYHTASAATSGLVLLLLIWCSILPSLGGRFCNYSGTWDDDASNWSRAMGGQSQPLGVVVLHSRYTRSPHFTYEATYYFEFTAPEKFLQDWVAFQKLSSTHPTELNTPSQFGGKPPWFIPKPLKDYDMWMPAGNGYDNFRIYRDKVTKTMYVSDSM
jgi:hypothetical protein